MIPAGSEVVVVGGGAAGLSAATRMAGRHRVTLVEAEARLGGHAWTWRVPDGPDEGLPLDLGFMVLNARNYPRMSAMLARLDGVEAADTGMSFGFWDEAAQFGFVVNGAGGSQAGCDPRFRALLGEVFRFQRRAVRDLEAGAVGEVELGEYLERLQASPSLVSDYLLPMGAAIWSTAPADLRRYPAEAFLAFFRNHGLLTLESPPQWRHVRGGSERYVSALLGQAPQLRIISEPARRVSRSSHGVEVQLASGAGLRADYVVLAVPADQALQLLDQPGPIEAAALQPWRYQTNHAVLHTDGRAMPPSPFRGCWTAWRTGPAGEGAHLLFSYDLNRLQNHESAAREYFLTLAGEADQLPRLRPDSVLLRTSFRHPVFSRAAMAGVRLLDTPQPGTRTFYCGSYFGYGFHEDAIRSGERVAGHFGAAPP
jgi:predicted NAD/FAD-binding protein